MAAFHPRTSHEAERRYAERRKVVHYGCSKVAHCIIYDQYKSHQYIFHLLASARQYQGSHPTQTAYVSLSVAAKSYFILKNERKPITRDEIEGVAKHFDWNIGPAEIERASDFLESLHLGAA